MRGARSDADAGVPGHRALGDRALVVALRSGTPAAIREFMARYRPLLVLAARGLSGSCGDADEIADEVLSDAVLHFMASGTAVPLSVRGYLLRSVRNRVLNAARGGGRRTHAALAAAEAGGDAEVYFEHVVPGCTSEYSVRASHGAQWEGPQPLAPALNRLAQALIAELSPEEQLMVAWLSHYVPHREIASWLGVGYDAIAKRIGRLRARLQQAAARHLEQLDGEERARVRAFLQGSGHESLAASAERRVPK